MRRNEEKLPVGLKRNCWWWVMAIMVLDGGECGDPVAGVRVVVMLMWVLRGPDTRSSGVMGKLVMMVVLTHGCWMGW